MPIALQIVAVWFTILVILPAFAALAFEGAARLLRR